MLDLPAAVPLEVLWETEGCTVRLMPQERAAACSKKAVCSGKVACYETDPCFKKACHDYCHQAAERTGESAYHAYVNAA